MKRQKVFLLLAASFTMLAVPGTLPAQESGGFWGRLNPFRRLVSRSSDTPDTVQPGRAEMQMEILRNRLAERGLTPTQIDAQIAQIQTAGQQSATTAESGVSGRPFSTPSGQPSLEDLRAHLISRGVDPAKIDARIERTMAAGAHGRANAAMRRGIVITDPPADAPGDVPGDIPTDVPGDIPTDVPGDIPTDVPGDIPIDVPGDVPTDGPADVPGDVPVDLPGDIPVDIPMDVPTEIPAPTPEAAASTIGTETATSSAPTETPVQTTTTSGFRNNARGLRGGFGRGRMRTR